MRNTWLVLKHEVLTTLRKTSFWLTTFLFPLIVVVLSVGGQLLSQGILEEETSTIAPEDEVVGYVDEAGLIDTIPEYIPSDALRSYATDEMAKEAVRAGDIGRYFVIPEDFVQTGRVILVDEEYAPLGSAMGSELIRHIVTRNLVGELARTQLLIEPMANVQNEPLDPEAAPDSTNPLTFVVPYAVLFIFFFVITMSSGYMLQSVAEEKENRVVEILLGSLKPRELMLGKVIGLGIVALLQMSLWVGAGLLAGNQAAEMFEVITAFEFPPGFFIWSVLFFLFGYLMFSSLMGALGALAPTMREGQQFTIVILLPLMIPLWLINAFVSAPNGPLVTVLSFFPLTSPVSMITRIVATSVPAWQPIVSLALLAGTTYLVILLTARIFRAQTLLSGASLSFKRVWEALRG